MSKDSFAPGELIGFIRFVFDVTKSRNLNATQAYDVSSTQIVLASYPATATKKSPVKSLGVKKKQFDEVGFDEDGLIGITISRYGKAGGDPVLVKNKLTKADIPAFISSATVNYSLACKQLGPENGEKHTNSQLDSVIFNGNQSVTSASDTDNATATKDIFYGSITVGTGLYREWQGKYAVLKVDLVTNNAILRVYNE